MAYSDVQKAIACELVKKNNGVVDDATVAAVRLAIEEPDLPRMTVWRWWKHYQSLAVADTVTGPNVTDVTDGTPRSVAPINREGWSLEQKLEAAAHKFLDHALRDELLIWLSAKDAMSSASIAIEKLRLTRGQPTEIVEVVSELIAELERGGADARAAFQVMLNKARAANAQR